MTNIRANSLDHIALWAAEREPLVEFACAYLGMHVIEHTDDFTLLGVDAREGKLTLFEAPGPREAGALQRIVLRVGNLEAAREALPNGLDVKPSEGGVTFEGPGGVPFGLVERDGLDYDLDHVVLAVAAPAETARRLGELGFESRDGILAAADRHVRLERGSAEVERPLLNHLALLVDSAEEVRREAERRELPIEKVVDAENTFAVFVGGPDAITVEYVEHKPGFSLT